MAPLLPRLLLLLLLLLLPLLLHYCCHCEVTHLPQAAAEGALRRERAALADTRGRLSTTAAQRAASEAEVRTLTEVLYTERLRSDKLKASLDKERRRADLLERARDQKDAHVAALVRERARLQGALRATGPRKKGGGRQTATDAGMLTAAALRAGRGEDAAAAAAAAAPPSPPPQDAWKAGLREDGPDASELAVAATPPPRAPRARTAAVPRAKRSPLSVMSPTSPGPSPGGGSSPMLAGEDVGMAVIRKLRGALEATDAENEQLRVRLDFEKSKARDLAIRVKNMPRAK